MSQSENIKQLDEKIRATVERAIRDLRVELSERLDAQQERLREALNEVSVDLPERFLSEDDLELETATPAVAEPAWDELKASIDQIDRARSQKEILRALVGGAARFASRSVVFLIRSGEVRGWESAGFKGEEDETIGGLAFEVPEQGPWRRLIDQEGTLVLGRGERGDLAERLETTVSQEAVLVPLFLRNRVAAALYADRMDDGPMAVEPLQTLTYLSALALESLPLRDRASTPTLRVGGEAAAAATSQPALSTEPSEGPVEEAVAAPSEPVAEAQPSTEGPPATLEESPPAAVAEPSPPPGTAVPPPATAEESIETEPAAAPSGLEEEEEMELDPMESESWTLDEPTPEVPSESPPPPVPPAAESESASTPVAEPATTGPALAKPTDEVSSSSSEPASDSSTEVGAKDESSSPQVQPPSDLEGPGWAFSPSSESEEMDSEEEARHEEAKRLARLLVSEIKLYNEEEVQEGRKNQDVVERLKEDLDRSRELYEQRVDEQVREKTDYFYQEMVRLLGGGDPKALGI